MGAGGRLAGWVRTRFLVDELSFFSFFGLTKAQDGEGCRGSKLQRNGLKINVVVVHFSRGVNRDKPCVMRHKLTIFTRCLTDCVPCAWSLGSIGTSVVVQHLRVVRPVAARFPRSNRPTDADAVGRAAGPQPAGSARSNRPPELFLRRRVRMFARTRWAAYLTATHGKHTKLHVARSGDGGG